MLIRRTPVNSPFARMVDRMIEHAARDVAPYAVFDDADFALALDVAEEDSNYVVKANLPGVKAENIDLNLHDNVLTISAEMQSEYKEENGRMLIQERRFGKYSRSLRFPLLVSAENVEAEYHDGVLSVRIHKAPEASAKRITIKNGSRS